MTWSERFDVIHEYNTSIMELKGWLNDVAATGNIQKERAIRAVQVRFLRRRDRFREEQKAR